MVVRKYEEELKFIEKITDYSWRIKKGFQVSFVSDFYRQKIVMQNLVSQT